jgi:hypothetical protein
MKATLEKVNNNPDLQQIMAKAYQAQAGQAGPAPQPESAASAAENASGNADFVDAEVEDVDTNDDDRNR